MTAFYQRYIDEEQLSLWQLFFCLIRRQVAEEEVAEMLAAGVAPEWARLVDLAARHRMLSILYVNLRKLGLAGRLPEDRREYLRACYLKITGGNMRLRHKLVETVDVLEKQGIPAVPFKGPVLAEILYDDSVLRHSGDLDVLVPGAAAGRAWEVLLAAGYRPVGMFLTEKQFAWYARFVKEFELVDPSGNVKIDLHWRLTGGIKHPFDYDFCRGRLRQMRFYGRMISCLSDEDMVVYLCAHGSYDLWDTIGAVLWVTEYIERRPELDWGLVLRLAEDLRSERMVLLGLFLARDLFGLELPEKIAAALEKDRAVAGLAGGIYQKWFGQGAVLAGASHIEQRFSQISYRLKIRRKIADKIGYLLWMMFWPSMREWDLRPLPAALAFLYYGFRPLRMGWEFGVAKGRKVFKFTC